MYPMNITHINKSSDAIGARVTNNHGDLGYVEGTCKDTNGSLWCSEYKIRWDDGSRSELSTREFEIVVELVDGAKYMNMAGDIRTLHKHPHTSAFIMEYAELGGSDSSELVYPNGSTSHYDCGMNLLKRVPDTEIPRRSK